MVIKMEDKSKNTICIIIIVILLIVLGISTFIKFTYDGNTEKKVEASNDELEKEAIDTLQCTLDYNSEDTKANITEKITVEFINDIPTNQKIIKVYTFDQEADYKSFESELQEDDNQKVTIDDENQTITMSESSDYSTPYNSENKNDFRNQTYEELEKYLLEQDYTCN